jgi:hypothetical protein
MIRVQELTARQPQIDAVVQLLVAAVGATVVVDHGADIALVDILGGEEEAVVVRPERTLKFTEVAGDIDEAAVTVGSRGPPVRGAGIDFIAPGQRCAPEIVIKGAGEMVGAGGTVAFCAIVGVVEV